MGGLFLAKLAALRIASQFGLRARMVWDWRHSRHAFRSCMLTARHRSNGMVARTTFCQNREGRGTLKEVEHCWCLVEPDDGEPYISMNRPAAIPTHLAR